jgi:hypothetical protein
MKCIFIFTYNPYLFYVKTRVNNVIIIQTILDKDFLNTLNNIVVGIDDKSIINMKIIFKSESNATAVKNLFLIHDVNFYSQDPNVLSLFQGYPFKSIYTLNMSIIQHFLDHILNNICNHNLIYIPI